MVNKEVIATGATTEEAIENGCRELGMSREDVKFEVIELPKSKTFGLFGGSPASVRVYVEYNQGQEAADYLLSIINAMGLEDIEIDIEPNEDGSGVSLNLKGDSLGAVIGRRGETLAALQYLVSLAANNSGEEYFRVAINIGNYREKREGSLENLARKTALRSIKIGRNLALDPMNPYERRIIHTAVQSVEGATSWSVDEGAKRHVVIGPEGVAEGEDGLPVNHSRSRNGGGRSGGYNSRGRSSYGGNRSGYNGGRRGGYSRGYGDDSENGGYSRGGYNRGGYNKGGYNKGGRRDYNGGYNRSSGYSAENTEPREARKDTSAPLYGRIVPKKREENSEE